MASFYSMSLRLYRFIFWRLHFILFSLAGSLKQACLLTVAYQGVVTVRGTRLCKEGPQNNFPSWSRSYEIVGVKRFKSIVASCGAKSGSIADVAIPVPKIYPSEVLISFPHENSNEAKCLPSKFR